jgi:hypothetical protein
VTAVQTFDMGDGIGHCTRSVGKPSGAWLFAVSPKQRNLIAQGLDPGSITTGHGDSEGKLKFLQLMIALTAAS